ncbi:MAG: hypothetical protein ACTSYU_12430 [Promethearchaeota archaeon]
MNEFSLITHLLSQAHYSDLDSHEIKTEIGCTEKKLLEVLGFRGKYAKLHLITLMEEYSQKIKVFGLEVKINPLNNHWYLAKPAEILKITNSNPFFNKTRLGATLMVIITLVMLSQGPVEKSQILQTRKKKSIDEDLEELSRMQYIVVDKSKVSLHPNLGYHLDLPEFLNSVERRSLKFDSYKAKNL